MIFLSAFGLAGGCFIYPAHSQSVSKNGWFTADFNKACAPFTIHLTESDTFPPATVRQYSFEGNGFFVAFNPGDTIEYSYSKAGVYKLVEVINKDYTGKTDTLEVTVYDQIIPSFTIFACEADGATLSIDNDPYDSHLVYYTPLDSVEVMKGNPVPSFTYPPGSHQVRVKGMIDNGKDNCAVSAQTFTTINNLVSASVNSLYLTRKGVQDGSLLINYTLAPNVVYQLQQAENLPAGFTTLGGLSGNQILIDSLDTQNKIQIFRIAAYDACQDKYLYSDTMATVTIEAKAENNQNQVNWQTYPVGFAEFRLLKNGQPFQVFGNPNLISYTDKNVTCFNSYCYSLVLVNTGGHQSFSDTVCVDAFSIYFPPAIRNTTTSADTKGFALSWVPPSNVSIAEYFIQREIGQDIYSTVDTVLTTQATDTSVDNTSGSSCYSVSYLDACRNRSNVGYKSCSIFLTLDKGLNLSWNEYTGWQNGVARYVLEVYDENGSLMSETDLNLQTGYLIEDSFLHQINSYRIKALSNDPEPFTAYSNTVIKTVNSVLNVPDAFTPDGDGLNDRFKPSGTEMKEFRMKIFSRRGNLLYETDNQDMGWDGTYNGKEVPADTYIFDIIAEDYQAKKIRLRGALVLLRH